MRRWWLALAFVPGLAWGDGECRSADARQNLVEMAQSVQAAVNRGASEAALLQWAGDIDTPGLKAAAYKAIEAYTFAYQSPSVSQVVTVMQYECKKQYRR